MAKAVRTPARRSRAESVKVWTELLRRFESSGLSATEFCKAEGVLHNSLIQWKRRLGSNPESGAHSADSAKESCPQVTPHSGVELVLQTGVVVRFGPGCEPDWIAAVIRRLGLVLEDD